MSVRTHRAWSPWLFLLPGLLVIAAFSLYPFLSTVATAFTDARTLVPGHWVGLRNFQDMLADQQFSIGLRNSALYVVMVVPLTVLLPLLLALLVQKQVPGIGFFRSAFYTPVVASAVVVALIWVWMLDDRGLINGILQFFGAGPVGLVDRAAVGEGNRGRRRDLLLHGRLGRLPVAADRALRLGQVHPDRRPGLPARHVREQSTAGRRRTIIAVAPLIVMFACLQRYFFRGVGEGAVKG